MAEKECYLQMKITETESMLEKCRTAKEAMGNTFSRLQKVTKGLLPRKMDHMKKKKKSERERINSKAKAHKMKRLENRKLRNNLDMLIARRKFTPPQTLRYSSQKIL